MCEESGGTAAVPGVGVFRRGRHGPFQGRWTPRGLKSGMVPLHSETDGFILRRDLALKWKSQINWFARVFPLLRVATKESHW